MKKALFILITFVTLTNAQISLVKDNIIAAQFMPYKNEMYFIGSDTVQVYPRQNVSLWKTNGTLEGSVSISSINFWYPESQTEFFYA